MESTSPDALSRSLLDAFPPNRSYSPADFLRPPMPESVARVLNRMLQEHLEAATPRDNAWIDFRNPNVIRASEAYRSELTRHIAVPQSAWAKMLRRACAAALSYLVQPVQTLLDEVFADGREAVRPEEVLSRVRDLPAYSYFTEILEAYFEQKDVSLLDRERFHRLLQRIDGQMTSDYSGEDWVRLIEPLVALTELIPEWGDGVPVEILRTFFQEKDVEAVVARLDARYTMKGQTLVPVSEIERLFVARVDDFDPDETVLSDVGRMVDSANRRVQDEGSVPLWKQFEKAGPPVETSVSVRSHTGPRHGRDSGSDRSEGGQPLWKQFRAEPVGDSKPPGGGDAVLPTRRASRESSGGRARDLSSLERTVLGERGAGNRDLFLRHLFGGSADDYEQTLRRLESAGSWSEASQIIAREVFLKHQVNIYSDAAVAFTDAAEGQYAS